jgi:hypothetical protein
MMVSFAAAFAVAHNSRQHANENIPDRSFVIIFKIIPVKIIRSRVHTARGFQRQDGEFSTMPGRSQMRGPANVAQTVSLRCVFNARPAGMTQMDGLLCVISRPSTKRHTPIISSGFEVCFRQPAQTNSLRNLAHCEKRRQVLLFPPSFIGPPIP